MAQKDLKNRIGSVKNIQKITRAMEMVAAARLRRAEQRIEHLRPYADALRRMTARAAQAADNIPNLPILQEKDEVNTVGVLLITGDDSHFVGSGLTAAFVHSLVRAKVPTAVGAVYDGGNDAADAPQRGAVLAPVLDDQTLSRAVSTIDDLDMVQGRVASVLALELIGSGNIGHYGYGSDASAPLPPHRS